MKSRVRLPRLRCIYAVPNLRPRWRQEKLFSRGHGKQPHFTWQRRYCSHLCARGDGGTKEVSVMMGWFRSPSCALAAAASSSSCFLQGRQATLQWWTGLAEGPQLLQRLGTRRMVGGELRALTSSQHLCAPLFLLARLEWWKHIITCTAGD